MPFFTERFRKIRSEKKTLLCAGLDPDPEKIPAGYKKSPDGTADFLSDVIRAASPYVAAFKLNLAFYEYLGAAGWEIFGLALKIIRQVSPDILIIADAKRGDIGNTARFYARTFFEYFDCDALTVQPFMGTDTLEPYLDYKDKGIIPLCYTSNRGSEEFLGYGDPPLYEVIATAINALNQKHGNLWMVVGATKESAALQRIRNIAPEVPFLVPGIGAQGGNLHETIRAAGKDVLINSSREMLYGAEDQSSVAAAVSLKAKALYDEIRSVCDATGNPL